MTKYNNLPFFAYGARGVQTTYIKQSKRAVVNLDLELGLARFSNLELDLEFKTDFQSCTGLHIILYLLLLYAS